MQGLGRTSASGPAVVARKRQPTLTGEDIGRHPRAFVASDILLRLDVGRRRRGLERRGLLDARCLVEDLAIEVVEQILRVAAVREERDRQATGASRSRPSSTSCMTSVAVHTFVIEPIWKSESGVTSTPVALLSTPVPVVVIDPSEQDPERRPGTR